MLFASLRATILEKKFLTENTKANIELDEVQQVEVPLHSKTAIELTLIWSNLEPIEEPLRRFGRLPYQPDRYFSFLVHDDDLIELDKNDKDLITYMDAL